MRERIYTIPVNEAFDASGDGCPFCALHAKLERDELDIILGASMMEPDIRIRTNRLGFCGRHYAAMFARNNRLQMALTLESHLAELQKDLKPGGLLSKDKSDRPCARIAELEGSCYVCERIEDKISKMFITAAYLFAEENDFKQKFITRKYICLPHYRRLLTSARQCLNKTEYAALYEAADKLVRGYLTSLNEDISWFCKKFDYRFDAEPWGTSRDSVERSIRFLCGDNALDNDKRK